MKDAWLFLKSLLVRFIRGGALYRAGSLAYTSLYSIVPIFASLMLALSFFPNYTKRLDAIETFVFNNLIASSGEQLLIYVKGFATQARQLSWIGAAALFVTTALLMFEIENAFNAIWQVEQRPGRFAILRAIGRHWLILILMPVLILLSLFVSSYVASLNLFVFGKHIVDYPRVLIKIIPTVSIFFVFNLLYYFMPAAKVSFKNASLASLLATVLFEALKRLFGLYVTFFPSYQIIYGAFAAIPIFLLWMYLVWVMILLCAQFCHALETR